jgi:hypothetical protein
MQLHRLYRCERCPLDLCGQMQEVLSPFSQISARLVS